MERHLILNVAGLTRKLLRSGAMPRLDALAQERGVRSWTPGLPAVTASVQADLLCGTRSGGQQGHGIVGNGWYFRDLAEVKFWPQSAHLLQQPTVHERWRQQHPGSQTAQLFWWWNLPSRADLSVTPRPTYWADGRKSPDIQTNPGSLRNRLQDRLGPFPLFQFWGPGANIASTRWIVNATLDVLQEDRPGLTLSYLPHLDYDLQRFGPEGAEALRAAAEVDAEAGRLLDSAAEEALKVTVLSEYGIEAVHQATFLNRSLRKAGYLQVHAAENGDLLDPGTSRAFAVCDHQCAHVYVAEEKEIPQVRALLEADPGVANVWGGDEQAKLGLDHSRTGELFCLARAGSWFAYPWWEEGGRQPDFAHTVEIHRKPGYDPCELFLAPGWRGSKIRLAAKRLTKKLGFRTLLDVIPTDTSLVRGSHGRPSSSPEEGPVWIGGEHGPISMPE